MLAKFFSAVLHKAPEFVANKVLSEIERSLDAPIGVLPRDLKRGRKLSKLLVRSHERSDWVALPGNPGRGALLAAALILLADQSEEWVVVALGTASRRSFVKEVFVRKGNARSVGLPASVQAKIRGHLEATPNAEVIHVHNHPDGIGRQLKNLFLGQAPLTSDDDRDVQGAHERVAKDAASRGLGRRNVRFFVVENGLLHQYWLPSKGPLRDEADRVLRRMLGFQ